DLLPSVRVIVTLGQLAWTQTLRILSDRGHPVPSPRPAFRHGVEVALGDAPTVLASYHPSQQNTFTGTLTEEMFDDVWRRARELAGP
ncbi:MAG TPA: uracil-DNA glycosylase family protein, partial [Longimicrobiales bacterium]|nr:uracil-DNA glycosylase family protein [Longimicrobiales bacterium]